MGDILIFNFFQEIGDKFSEIGGRLNYPRLTKELVHEIGTLWRDSAIQVGRASSKWFRVVFTELSDLPTQFFYADFRKHISVVMNFNFQIVLITLWKIYKDCLMQTMFLLRYVRT